MANPIKQLVNSSNAPTGSFNEYGGVQGVLSKFNEFKNQFKGNPKDIVNNMLRSGRINESQLNQAKALARQLRGIIK